MYGIYNQLDIDYPQKNCSNSTQLPTRFYGYAFRTDPPIMKAYNTQDENLCVIGDGCR